MYDMIDVVYVIDDVEYSRLECELTVEVIGGTLG
jgi:hypothetical protein